MDVKKNKNKQMQYSVCVAASLRAALILSFDNDEKVGRAAETRTQGLDNDIFTLVTSFIESFEASLFIL